MSQQETSEINSLTDCVFFLKYMCTKGESCEFRHCEAAQATTRICKFWLKNQCNDINCMFRHPTIRQKADPTKTKCYFFSVGQCTKGDACPFIHEKVQEQKTDTKKSEELPVVETQVQQESKISSDDAIKKRKARFLDLINNQVSNDNINVSKKRKTSPEIKTSERKKIKLSDLRASFTKPKPQLSNSITETKKTEETKNEIKEIKKIEETKITEETKNKETKEIKENVIKEEKKPAAPRRKLKRFKILKDEQKVETKPAKIEEKKETHIEKLKTTIGNKEIKEVQKEQKKTTPAEPKTPVNEKIILSDELSELDDIEAEFKDVETNDDTNFELDIDKELAEIDELLAGV